MPKTSVSQANSELFFIENVFIVDKAMVTIKSLSVALFY